MIDRPLIIDFIRRFYGTPLVKELTGIRRCGKTSLLKLIETDLRAEKIAESYTRLCQPLTQ